MSIRNSIANVRKPIGSGMDRDAFYSPTYNLVIKKSRRKGMTDDQTIHERSFFFSLSEENKKFFPVIDYMKDARGNWVCLMKKCTPIMKYGDAMVQGRMKEYYWQTGRLNSVTIANSICAILGISNKGNRELVKLIKDSNLWDIHFYNVGVLDNRLVILDAGI